MEAPRHCEVSVSTIPARHCVTCGAVITACMGFGNAGDFLALLAGTQEVVREICGVCMLKRDLTEYEQESR